MSGGRHLATAFMALPLWGKLALAGGAAFVLAVVVCNLIGRPKNPHNYQADTLATTRKAYAADTVRLLQFVDVLKVRADSLRAAKDSAQQKWIQAEQRGAAARVTAATAKTELRIARNVRDSLVAALVVIASQDTVIASLTTALDASHAAFGRLTAENEATRERADSLDAGWRRTRDRLGIAEAALAVEQKRTSCSINLVLAHVKCPSRGVMLVVGVVGGIAADKYLLGKKAP